MRKVIHPDFPDYFIRDDGLVERRVDSRRYHKAGLVLCGRVLTSGYRQFNLRDVNGCKRLVRGNRLVCEAFHGTPPTPDHHSAHRNGVRLDNSPENLYWATAKENKTDSVRHGTAAIGERVGTARLTADAVKEARQLFDGRRGTLTALSKKYGVGIQTMRRVLEGSTWAHVIDRPKPPYDFWMRLSDSERRLLVAQHASDGMSAKQSAAALETSRDIIIKFAGRHGIRFAPRWEQRNWANLPGRSALDMKRQAGA
jgi:hypothetical protein